MDQRAVPSPVIILIGGMMTVDDGTSIDSRQAVEGDPSSRVTHASLATSLLWWITAASLIGPVLDSAAADAFALVLGGRSVAGLRPDGTMRRTSLRSFLPGGTGNIEIKLAREPLPGRFGLLPDAYYNGTLGLDPGEPGKRWRFFNGNEYFLRHAGTAIGPSAIIDTSRSLMDGTQITGKHLEDLQETRLFDPSLVLVLPHTHRAEALINAYHEQLAHRWHGPQHSSDWDPQAPPTRSATPSPSPSKPTSASPACQQEAPGVTQPTWKRPGPYSRHGMTSRSASGTSPPTPSCAVPSCTPRPPPQPRPRPLPSRQPRHGGHARKPRRSPASRQPYAPRSTRYPPTSGRFTGKAGKPSSPAACAWP